MKHHEGYAELFRIAWPLIISTGSFTIMNFFDRMFLAQYELDAFRAVLPASIMMFTLSCGFISLASYTGTFVAQYDGAGDLESCGRVTMQGLWVALLSIPLLLLLIPLGNAIFVWCGHGPRVVELECQYFGIVMIGAIGQIIAGALGGFYSGRGLTKVCMICNLIANGVNILLDYLFVFGNWGFPEWGMPGAAWASVFASFLTVVMYVALIFRRQNNQKFALSKACCWDGEMIRRLLRFGVPSGVQFMLDVGAFTLFTLLIGRMGELPHICSNLVLSISQIAFMPMFGFGMAATILVGQYMGSHDHEGARHSAIRATRVCMIYSIFSGLIFICFPRVFVDLFIANIPESISAEAVLALSTQLMWVLAGWGTMDAVAITLASALKGAGDTKFVLIYQTIMAWGFFGVGELLLVFVFHGGVLAAWLLTLIYIVLLGIGYTLRFNSNAWQKIEMI